MPGATQEWQNRTRGLLRSEMARRNISNRQLVELLGEIGVKSNARWMLAEGADAGAMARSIPIEKVFDDALLA